MSEEVAVHPDFARLAKEFGELTLQKRVVEKTVKEFNKKLEPIENELIKLAESLDLEKITIKGVGTVMVADKISAKIVDDKAMIAWIKKHPEVGEIAKYTVHSSTLGAVCRERLENMESAPDGVSVTPYKKVSLLKK